jgi:F-type H+-transporting ATPase subunit b
MQIDWVTVAAQVVNFLILVYLLKRFLYRPVINAMARRAQGISDRLDEAKRRETEAQLEANRHRAKNEEFENKREALLAAARGQADEERRALLDQARTEVDETRRKWREQVAREKNQFLDDIKAQMADSIIKISRRVLRDLADAELERQLVGVILRRLESPQEHDRRFQMRVAGPVQITTSFELNDELRARVAECLASQFGRDADIHYRRSPDLACGIELSAGGQKLAWGIGDYLDQLQTRMETAMGSAMERGSPQLSGAKSDA